jgi:hypothetical protein
VETGHLVSALAFFSKRNVVNMDGPETELFLPRKGRGVPGFAPVRQGETKDEYWIYGVKIHYSPHVPLVTFLISLWHFWVLEQFRTRVRVIREYSTGEV